MSITSILNKVNQYILNPIIKLLFAVALLVFFWGIFMFISQAANEEARKKGKLAMEWGVKGLFIMVAVYGILHLVLNTFGISDPAYLKY